MPDDNIIVFGPIDIALHGIALKRHSVLKACTGIVGYAAFAGAAAVRDDPVVAGSRIRGEYARSIRIIARSLLPLGLGDIDLVVTRVSHKSCGCKQCK